MRTSRPTGKRYPFAQQLREEVHGIRVIIAAVRLRVEENELANEKETACEGREG